MFKRCSLPLLPLAAMLCISMACNLIETQPTPGATLAIREPTLSSSVSPSETAAAHLQTPGKTEQPQPTAAVNLPTPATADLRLAYTKDGNLWSWVEGRTRQLTSSGRVYLPKLSSDGRLIAYLRPADDFHTELWVIHTDGTQERRLVSISDLDIIGGGVRDPSAAAINPYRFEWLPGTHTLAFNTQQIFQGPGLSLLNDLNLVDADSGELTFLLLSGWGGEFFYSPDGKYVALATTSAIILADANGGNYRKVFEFAPVATYSDYRFYPRPAWSKDSSFLRVAIPPADPLARPAQPTTLWTIPLDGAPVQDGQVVAVAFFETPVAYSPDLQRLIYIQEVGQPAENLRELWIATYDGQGGWPYNRSAMMRFESWSPASNQFVFIAGEMGLAWLGSLEEAPQPFSRDPAGIQRVRWVDDQRILYLKQQSGAFDLWLNQAGNQPVLLDTVLGDPPSFDFVLVP